jgi:RHS repeat-associated protein
MPLYEIDNPGTNNTSPPDGPGCSDPIAYKGQSGCYTDPEISAPYSLVYCHNRYYCTFLGRWMSRDPTGAEGGINVYSFCGTTH